MNSILRDKFIELNTYVEKNLILATENRFFSHTINPDHSLHSFHSSLLAPKSLFPNIHSFPFFFQKRADLQGMTAKQDETVYNIEDGH